ncbi:hypothetical protein VTN31DRAFT_6782 [Thermomyces dupontii]|uniref:uncharacterized protein n=1 Tax=Talaromyces thermophilus TaxID=28565 RepID=UPI003743C2B9
MQTFQAELYLDIKSSLSEGPYYDAATKTLRFVDIVKKEVWFVDVEKGPESAKINYDISMGVTANISGKQDEFLFGGKHGIGVAGPRPNEYRYVKRYWPEERNHMRANDGAVDSRGRFWIGTMTDQTVVTTGFKPNGTLFRYDLDGSLHTIIENVTIPNGISWSLDDKIMYWTDSETKSIYAFDFDPESGAVSNQRVFFKTKEGVPDGHAQDVHGNLWVAVWGSWKVLRISPEGVVTGVVNVPTRCPTAVVFVDEDIYITSEADPEIDKYPESKPYVGGIFKCHVGVRGREPFHAKVPTS